MSNLSMHFYILLFDKII